MHAREGQASHGLGGGAANSAAVTSLDLAGRKRTEEAITGMREVVVMEADLLEGSLRAGPAWQSSWQL